MEFPTFINWTNPIQILGLLGSKFQFHSNFKKVILQANSAEPDQTPRSAASDMVLHCLSMSHKKDARLIWVKPWLSTCT